MRHDCGVLCSSSAFANSSLYLSSSGFPGRVLCDLLSAELAAGDAAVVEAIAWNLSGQNHCCAVW